MTNFTMLKEAVKLIERGEEIALATVTKASGSTPREEGTKMIVLEDGTIYGTVGGGNLESRVIDESIEALKNGQSFSLYLPLEKEELGMECGGEVEVFIDVFKSKPKLLIVGGGHVGLAIYEIASILDFDITVFEDRQELLAKERFPLAKELILGNVEENLSNYPIDENTYIVIVTRGHKYDESCLENVVESNAKYIGVMGSKRKVKVMMDSLKKKGIDEDLLERVYTPIGLNLGGETPEEIAISIMSEILLIKNSGSLIHMKSTRKDNIML
ncbi:MAG TPA: XdhC/CoxI family protein [Tissierellales bacterium]|nr:XdhC/CoxI family protein [Tissierellales bacterium]